MEYWKIQQGTVNQYDQMWSTVWFCQMRHKVLDHLRSHFEKMTQIFRNTEVQLEDIGEFLEKFAHDHKINQAPRHIVIGSYFGEKICLTTPLVKWYLEHGLIITKIYKVVEFTSVAAFKDFTIEVANALRPKVRSHCRAYEICLMEEPSQTK